MSAIAAIAAVVPAISGLLDRWIPDPEQKAKAQLDLFRLQQEGAFKALDVQLQTNLAQAKINEVEAASQRGFQASWRPLAGYVCVLGLGYEFLLRPLLPWALTVSGVGGVPPLPSLDGVLFELVFGMLGLGGMRSADRAARVKALSKV